MSDSKEQRSAARPAVEASIARALAERRARLSALERRDARFADARMAVVLIAALAALASVVGSARWTWALPPAGLAFVVLVFRHADVIRCCDRARRAVGFQERRSALAHDTWAGTGSHGERFRQPGHDYALDLDLFGGDLVGGGLLGKDRAAVGSIFELLCAAPTWMGEQTCARWLLEAADAATVRARQDAARELIDRAAMREALWVAAPREVRSVDPAPLTAWAAAPTRIRGRATLRWGAALVSVVTLTAIGLRVGGHPWGGFALAPALLLHLGFYFVARRGVDEVTAKLDSVAPALAAYREILACIESEPFTSTLLRREQAALGASRLLKKAPRQERTAAPGEQGEGSRPVPAPVAWGWGPTKTALFVGRGAGTAPRGNIVGLPENAAKRVFQQPVRDAEPSTRNEGRASDAVRGLSRISEWLDNLHDFYLAAFVAPVVFWKLHCALALEDWREAHGAELGRWLAAIGEVEALAGFAAVAETHPEWAWPEVLEVGASAPHAPTFEARELGHPLIPPAQRVCNDLTLGAEPQILMVSGSNMSGKSTWLRATGVSAAMALAGAPVCARSMTLEPVHLVTSIRVVDSLAEGASHFLAEVLRLKRALEVAMGPRPVLVLFDEILQGTNSRERSLGARAVIRRLVECHAIGLVTTHDLALVALAEELGARADNVHFADHVDKGGMAFDYKMRSGVLRTTNALALMRSVGIDLEFEEA